MSAGRYYLGIDIGTYESKGVVIDGEGAIVAQASAKHGLENPKPGFFEHDAEVVWWGDFCKVSRQLLKDFSIRPEDIGAVGVSTLGSDCLPVDAQCKPLRKAILYGIDARAQKEMEELTAHYGEAEVKRLFGRPIVTGDVAPKILWIKNNEPDVYQQTHKFLTGSSYIVAKLTGEYVVDRFLAQASFRPLYQMDGEINTERSALYCRPEQLAAARMVTDIAGYVTAKAAEETGLPEGTPVTTGTGDSAAEAISTGVLEPGDMMLQFGSSLFIYCCTDKLVEDDRVRGNSFTIPGTWSIAAGTNAAGTLTRWYRDTMFADYLVAEEQGGGNAYDAMMQGLEEIPAGSDGLITLPYLAGERTPINDPNAKGMVFGVKLSHTRAHMYRSALESVGYSVAQHLDVLRERGVFPKKVMAVGGGTKTPVWMQIVADIAGIPLHIAEVTIGASYGDALMAAIGAGRFAGFSDLKNMIQLSTTIQPDLERHRAYQPYRTIYDELYTATKDLMHRL